MRKHFGLLLALVMLLSLAACCKDAQVTPISAIPNSSGKELFKALREKRMRTKLALVRLERILADGTVWIEIDNVEWVDDYMQPNGYRIDNNVEEWVSYLVTSDTEYALWHYIPDVGMQLIPMSLEDWISELGDGWRQGILLADIEIERGQVGSIVERYVP